MNPPQVPDYKLRELIGEGATGSVWLADYQGQTDLALKAFKGLAINRQLLSDALVKIYNHPPHPGIVKIFDFDLASPQAYLTMELCAERVQLADGRNELRPRNLESLCGALAPDVGWGFAQQIADALAFLHRRRITHCNLKPSNVLFEAGDSPHLKVCDFAQGMLGGIEQIDPGESLFYAAPEQMRDPDHFFEGRAERWDVYSFGATVFRLLTGKFPRLDEEIEEFRRNHKRDLELRTPADPARIADALAAHAEIRWPTASSSDQESAQRALIGRCLSIEPDDRPVDMREVLENFREIDAVIDYSTEIEELERSQMKLGNRARKARRRASLFGAGAIAAAGVAAFALYDRLAGGNDSPEPEAPGTSMNSSSPRENPALAEERKARMAAESQLAAAMDDLRQSDSALDEVFGLIAARDAEGNRIYSIPEGTLGTILNYYDEFVKRHRDHPEMAEPVARALNNSGELCMMLGDHLAARTNLRGAATLLESLEVGGGENGALIVRQAQVYNNLSDAETASGMVRSAVDSAKRADSLYKSLLDRNPESPVAKRAFARSSLHLGRKLAEQRQAGEAGIYIDRAAGLLRRLEADNQVNESDLALLAATHFERGRVERLLGNGESAIKAQIEAIDRYLALGEASPESAEHSFQLARAYGEAADLAALLGEPGDARSANKEASELLGALAAADPEKPAYRFHLAKRLRASAQLLRDGSSAGKALEEQAKALVLLADLHQHHPNNSLYTYDYALVSGIHADLLGEAGKKEDAVALARQAVDLMKVLLTDDTDPENNNGKRPRYRQRIAFLYGKLGHHAEVNSNKDLALHCFEKAMKHFESLTAVNPDDKVALDGIAWAKDRMERLN